jgi:hypothetical protein
MYRTVGELRAKLADLDPNMVLLAVTQRRTPLNACVEAVTVVDDGGGLSLGGPGQACFIALGDPPERVSVDGVEEAWSLDPNAPPPPPPADPAAPLVVPSPVEPPPDQPVIPPPAAPF